MSSIVGDIYTLQAKYGFNHEPLDIQKLRFRGEQIEEELSEFGEAVNQGDAEGIVDALIDLTVFALGTLAIAGVDIQEAWDEVHFANMAKERGVKPGRDQSEGWDLIKPKDWRAPDHANNTGFLNDIYGSPTMREVWEQ
jgi:predicted HAD superfamily Cof-like phosphohydrolase